MPELEAWQKVIITGNNGNVFLASVHGPNYNGDLHHPLSCQHCHGGQPDGSFATMAEAHVGLIADPSATGPSGCVACHDGSDGVPMRSACDGCHAEIVTRTANSLHTTQQGYFTAIEQRGGMFTASHEPWFEARCAGCHTTCSQCHISRPKSVGSGFMLRGGVTLSSHRFYRTPDMSEQCTACHGTRVGDDYRGVLTGQPDVHFSRGMHCVACHSAGELHGDGTAYEHRYQVAAMPRCTDCHAGDVAIAAGQACASCHPDHPTDHARRDIPAADIHHAHHLAQTGACDNCHHQGPPARNLPTLQCQACHSQPYKNCTNCHDHTLEPGHTGFAIEPSTIQFKLARNPSPYRQEHDIAVVRHAAVSPQTYANWGLELPGFENNPTWLYSSPHNIRKNTAQTAPVAGESCSFSCHQSATGPEGVLLRAADLGAAGSPTYNANIGIVIPDGWPTKK